MAVTPSPLASVATIAMKSRVSTTGDEAASGAVPMSVGEAAAVDPEAGVWLKLERQLVLALSPRMSMGRGRIERGLIVRGTIMVSERKL